MKNYIVSRTCVTTIAVATLTLASMQRSLKWLAQCSSEIMDLVHTVDANLVHRYTDNNFDVTIMPGIASMPQILKITIDELEKDGKKRGEDFEVPHLSWMYYALLANNERWKDY